jgi:hypothetical protein
VTLSSWNVFTPLGILKDWSISLPGTCAYNFHVFMNSWLIKVHENQVINFTTRHLCLQLSCFHEFMNSWLIKVHENQVMLSWIHENQVMLSWIHESMTYQGTWKSGDAFMNSWIHDLSRYMKIRLCFHEFRLIKVHENLMMKYESNICTAIIKVHENQVMQKILWDFSIFKVNELFTLLKSADCLHC